MTATSNTTPIQTDPSSMNKIPAQISIWDGKQWLEIGNQQTINTLYKNVTFAQKTADGKNSITWGTTAPTNPITNDIWLKKDSNGNYSIQVYNGTSWDSPAEANIEQVKTAVNALPKSIFSTDKPAGTDYTSNDRWYKQTGTDANGNPIYQPYIWDTTKQDWLPMLNAGEVDNQNQIAAVKDNLTTAQNDITTAKSDIASVSSDLDTAKSDLQSGIDDANKNITTAQNNITAAQADLATAKNNIATNADAIKDANGNISALQKSATTLESDLTDAQNDISSLQQTATTFQTAISNNAGDISTLQQSAKSFQTAIDDANNSISTLQQDAKSFQTSIANNAGDISTLKQTATSLQTGLQDANGNISGLQESAATFKTAIADAQGSISILQQDSNSFNISIGQLTTAANGNNLLNESHTAWTDGAAAEGTNQDNSNPIDDDYLINIDDTIWNINLNLSKGIE